MTNSKRSKYRTTGIKGGNIEIVGIVEINYPSHINRGTHVNYLLHII